MTTPTIRAASCLALLALVGCETVASALDDGAEAAPREPLHVTVVCDASSSALEAACTTESISSVARAWVTQAIRRPGSTMSVIQVGSSRDGTETIATFAVPSNWGRGIAAARARFVSQTIEAAESLHPSSSGSAIVEAIDVAADGLSEHTGDRVLAVLSDLRQDAPGNLHFERRVVSPRRFVTWLEEHHLLAQLGEIRVEVCGVHGARGPRAREHTAAADDALRATWARAFEAMGQEDVTLHRACDAQTLTAFVEQR